MFISEFNVKEHEVCFLVSYRLYLDVIKLSKGAALFNLLSSKSPKTLQNTQYFLTLLMPTPRNRICCTFYFLLTFQVFGGNFYLIQISLCLKFLHLLTKPCRMCITSESLCLTTSPACEHINTCMHTQKAFLGIYKL